MSVMTQWTLAQAQGFTRENLNFEHGLHDRPLFSDAGLAEILDIYPREKLGVFTMGDDPVAWRTWRRGIAKDLSGAELIEAVKKGRIWLNLRAVNERDERYADLCDEIFNEVESKTGLRTFRRDVGLLISSPKVQVFYHLDVAMVMLWQLRGAKTVWLYPPEQPYIDELQLERIVLKESGEQFDYDPRWDLAADKVVLTPGKMVTWPQNAPHRIENGDMMNVSLSIEFMTAASLMRANVIYANGMLRKTFGARPKIQKGLDPRAIAKVGAARAWKALNPAQRTKDPMPVTFALGGDAGEIIAI